MPIVFARTTTVRFLADSNGHLHRCPGLLFHLIVCVDVEILAGDTPWWNSTRLSHQLLVLTLEDLGLVSSQHDIHDIGFACAYLVCVASTSRDVLGD